VENKFLIKNEIKNVEHTVLKKIKIILQEDFYDILMCKKI